MNRIYAEGLGEIRRFAAPTQTGLAERMGIKQAAVSRIEGRGTYCSLPLPSTPQLLVR